MNDDGVRPVLTERRPRGLLRVLLRAPVLMYRARLGWLLGHRFLYLAHRGRATGRRRDVVLEVVRYDERAPEVIVVAAWGPRSDWYRNITASPALEVRVGHQRWLSPAHRVLESAELAVALQDYAGRHPRAWRALAPRMGLAGEMSEATARTAAERFPAVAFTPAGNAEAPEA